MSSTETEAAQSRYRFLDPETLLRLGKINIVARSVVEVWIAGMKSSLTIIGPP